MSPRPLATIALVFAVVLGLPAGPLAAQERGESPQTGDQVPPWAVSFELIGGLDAVYGAWRRVLPGVDAGIELQTAWEESRTEVDRLDRPGAVNAFTDRDRFVVAVGPSARWRVRSGARLSPVLRAHAGYVRNRTTFSDDTGDFERTADGMVVRGSAGVDYRVSGHLDVVLSIAGSWSVLEGEVLFHADETSRSTELDLLMPAAAIVIRF